MNGGDRMNGQRQDAWTEQEDLILAETVLKHIRQGSTQLSAFKDVGLQLSRTPAACGFRWNSTIRKQYEKAIALAKQQRKQRNTDEKVEKPSTIKEEITLTDVIEFLKNVSASDELVQQLRAENEKLTKQLNNMKVNYEGQLMELQKENEMLKQDYKTMFEIIDRASKVVSVNKDETKANQ